MNFEEILCLIGGFGKFQKTLYIWICLPQIFLAFHMLVSVFTGAVPPHLCHSSGGPQAFLNFTFSSPSSLYGQSELSCTVPLNLSGDAGLGDGHPSEKCQGGWGYSTETFQSTIVTEVSEKQTVCRAAFQFRIWLDWIFKFSSKECGAAQTFYFSGRGWYLRQG